VPVPAEFYRQRDIARANAKERDQRRGLLGAVDADSGAEHPAARAVATRLVRCESEALAHYASTDWKWCACAPFARLMENAGASQRRSCAK